MTRCSNAPSSARPDDERGQVVQAHVVLKEGATADAAMILRLQNHVKATIAPYKYPRSIKFAASLPKTQSGKIQRFQLRGGSTGMTEDLFERTRALFDLPAGRDLSRRQFARGDAQGGAERVRRELDESWGRELIRAWNTAGWIDMPSRIGDRIGELIGAPSGSVMAADSTSVNLYKALNAALRLAGPRKTILSDSGNFPTDLYIAEGVIATLDRGHDVEGRRA